MAEHEREMISRRTKEDLAAAKARGVKLGTPTPRKEAAIGVAPLKARADQFAANVGPVIADIQKSGVTSLGGLPRLLKPEAFRQPVAGHGMLAPLRTCCNGLGRHERSVTVFRLSPAPAGFFLERDLSLGLNRGSKSHSR